MRCDLTSPKILPMEGGREYTYSTVHLSARIFVARRVPDCSAILAFALWVAVDVFVAAVVALY